MTFTPDSKLVYIATENTDSVVAVDVAARKEVTRIKVGPLAEAEHHDGDAVVRWPLARQRGTGRRRADRAVHAGCRRRPATNCPTAKAGRS